jgi:hypothetical protein
MTEKDKDKLLFFRSFVRSQHDIRQKHRERNMQDACVSLCKFRWFRRWGALKTVLMELDRLPFDNALAGWSWMRSGDRFTFDVRHVSVLKKPKNLRKSNNSFIYSIVIQPSIASKARRICTKEGRWSGSFFVHDLIRVCAHCHSTFHRIQSKKDLYKRRSLVWILFCTRLN